MTLIVQEFTIIGIPNTSNYTLTNGSSPSTDDYIIVIQLDVGDVNNIKANLNVAVSNISTVLSLTPSAISDMNSNPLRFDQPLIVANFFEDNISPVLLYYDLDLNSNLLTLTFNETIRVESLNVSEIVIQDSPQLNDSDPGSYRMLEAGLPLTMDSTVLVIELNADDTNYIKRYTNLATSENNTYISFSELTLQDMNGNPITLIPANDSRPVRIFIPDLTTPFLVSYELDLTAEELRFVFNETVNVGSFDAQRLTLYANSSTESTSYTLTGGHITVMENDTDFILALTTFDLNEIKKLEDLAVSTASSFLAFDEALLVDMNNNPVQSTEQSPEPTTMFAPDTVHPELQSFHLDMNIGYLHLNFSETVDVSSLQPAYFTLLNRNSSSAYQLHSYRW